jgi:phenylacetate-CoA ligase
MLEHGFRWRHTTAQFQILRGPSHPLQQFGIARKTWISTVDPLEKQLRQFLESRADFVVGTPTALRRITEAIVATGANPKRPRMVFCAGELLDRATADTIRGVLGVCPAGIYGQTEVGYLAWQCERRDLFHLNTDTHLVEVVRAGKVVGPGELGELVITDLRSRTMPFLRYRTTDLAVGASGLCPCGRTLPLLRSLEGRARACLVLKSGRLITAREIVDNLSDMATPGTYRVEQLTPDRFRLQLLPNAVRSGGEGIVGRLHRILGQVDISIETVNSWAPDGTGKTHTVHSDLASLSFE